MACPDDEVKINLDNTMTASPSIPEAVMILDISIRQSPSVVFPLPRGRFDADTGELTETGQNLVKV